MPFLIFTSSILCSFGWIGTAYAQEETLSLLSVQPVSPTEIRITASAPVTFAPDAGMRAFILADSKGNLLSVTKLILRGHRVILFTLPQNPGEHYVLTLSDALRGKIPQGEGWRAIPLDGEALSYAFSGFSFEQNEEEFSPSEPLPPPSPLVASVSATPPTTSLSPLKAAETFVFIAAGGIVGWYVSRKFRQSA